MRVGLPLLLVAVFANGVASADVISARPDTVQLTIYHDPDATIVQRPDQAPQSRDEGLALIRETRTVTLPAGRSIVRFRGVASTMVPQSATIDGLPAGAVEQNFDYDLLNPGGLLAKSVGAKVHVVRTNPGNGAMTDRVATVRSGPDGTVFESSAGVEALDCSGLPEKLVFDRVPKGLTDTPTLSIHVRLARAGRYTISLGYLATGLNWAATYVGRVSPDGATLDLIGWLTIANSGSTTFGNLPVEVVAGGLSRTGDDVPIDPPQVSTSARCWPMDINWATAGFVRQTPDLWPPPAPPPWAERRVQDVQTAPVAISVFNSEKIDARALGDYKLYALPEPTTVAALQTKQIQFLDRHGLPIEKVYVVAFNRGGVSTASRPQVVYRLRNAEKDGVGRPLPAGSVSLRDANAVLLGQNDWSDTPVGVPLQMHGGRTSDVLVEDRIVRSETLSSHDLREEHEVTVRNAKPVPIVFELRPDFADDPGRIVSESRPHVDDPFGTAWQFSLAAHDHQTIRYTIEWQD